MPVLAPTFSPTDGVKLGIFFGALLAVGILLTEGGNTSGEGS
jgi:hypothetical protein